MTTPRRPQIVAMGGGGFSMEPENARLDDFVLGLAGVARPRVAFVPTASGDSPTYVAKFMEAFPRRRAQASVLTLFQRTELDFDAFLAAQDVVYVGGGNTVNLLACWRAHGLDRALRRAWRRGVVMTGVSAGALCWFEGGTTDSYGGFAPLHDGLGWLNGTVSPHYDGEAARRPTYQAAVRDGLPAGYGLDDGAAAHYVGRRLVGIVSSRPGAAAWRVEQVGRTVVESQLPGHLLPARRSRK
jgi:dipeptidase E